jgi:hypothetical protein
MSDCNDHMSEMLACCGDMVQHGPGSTICKLDRREVDTVEVRVVLAHELIELDLFWVEPPFFPFFCVVCCYTRVAYRCIILNPN